jgi:molybdopterin synthase sulfur carrier subunit
MMLTILTFGIAKEIMNGSEVELNFDHEITVADLRTLLENQYPRLKQLQSFLIAVNSEYASPAQIIKQNDEIAIIPPVSGG